MGLAIAHRFLQSGASFSLWDIDREQLASAEQQLLANSGADAARIHTDVVDVAVFETVDDATKKVAERFGKVDLLVNSAGIAGVNALLADYPVDIWKQVHSVNLDGIFHTCKAVVPLMQQRDYGRIVNIASVAGKDGNPNASAYSVSKAAVMALTKSLGKELATSGIRVNAITPAVVGTEMLNDVTEAQIDYMLAKIPMRRMGTVEEIAAMVAWLSSEECSYSTGAIFDMSGGRATY